MKTKNINISVTARASDSLYQRHTPSFIVIETLQEVTCNLQESPHAAKLTEDTPFISGVTDMISFFSHL